MSSTQTTRLFEKVDDHRGIYTTPAGKYVVRYRDGRGKVANSERFNTLREAIRFKGKIDSGERHVDARIPFRRYAEQWIKTYRGRKAGGASEETRDSYELTLRTQAIPFFGMVRLGKIDRPLLKAYVAHLEDKGYAPATIRRYFAPVRALLADAYEDGALTEQMNIRVVLTNEHTRPTRRRLTAEETRRLLAEIPVAQADVALFFATTGARLEEPFPLRYRDFGHDAAGHPIVRFPRSKTPAGLKPIRLTPAMSQALTRRRAEQAAGPDDLVFPSILGKQRTGRSWRRCHFDPAAERAGVSWATPHMLRHGVATLMARAGAEPYDIARMLRHADGGRLAQQTYIHSAAPSVAHLDRDLGADAGDTTPNTTTPQILADHRESKTP